MRSVLQVVERGHPPPPAGTGSNRDVLRNRSEAAPLEPKHERRSTDLPSAQFQNRPGLTPEKPEPYREGGWGGMGWGGLQ